MSIDIVFKIAAVGLIVAVLHTLLVNAKKEGMALMLDIAGLVVVLLMVVNLVGGLFDSIKQIFGLY